MDMMIRRDRCLPEARPDLGPATRRVELVVQKLFASKVLATALEIRSKELKKVNHLHHAFRDLPPKGLMHFYDTVGAVIAGDVPTCAAMALVLLPCELTQRMAPPWLQCWWSSARPAACLGAHRESCCFHFRASPPRCLHRGGGLPTLKLDPRSAVLLHIEVESGDASTKLRSYGVCAEMVYRSLSVILKSKCLLSASIGKFTLLDYQSHRLHRVWLSAFSRSAEALWANNVPMCPGLFEPRGGDRCQGRVLLVDSDRPSSGAARTSEISDEGRMERLLPCGRFPSLRDYVRLAFCAANHPAEGPNFGPRWTLRGLGFRLASSSVLGSFACTARASATVVVALRDPTAAMKWATRHRHGGCNAKVDLRSASTDMQMGLDLGAAMSCSGLETFAENWSSPSLSSASTASTRFDPNDAGDERSPGVGEEEEYEDDFEPAHLSQRYPSFPALALFASKDKPEAAAFLGIPQDSLVAPGQVTRSKLEQRKPTCPKSPELAVIALQRGDSKYNPPICAESRRPLVSRAMSAAAELEHFIGYGGKHLGTVCYHPSEAETLIYVAASAIIVENVNDPHKQEFLRGHDAEVSALDVSLNGKLLASGQLGSPSRKGAVAPVVVWDFDNRSRYIDFHGLAHSVLCVKFSPDGRFLVAAGANQMLYVWDVSTGEVVYNRRTESPCFLGVWGPILETGIVFVARAMSGTENLELRPIMSPTLAQQEQDMSPSTTPVLEGETSGPGYGTVTMLPGLQQPDSGSQLVNGTELNPGQDGPSMSAPVSANMDDISTSTSKQAVVMEPAASTAVEVPRFPLSSISTDPPVVTTTAQRVEVGGFTFSPPEDLPDYGPRRGDNDAYLGESAAENSGPEYPTEAQYQRNLGCVKVIQLSCLIASGYPEKLLKQSNQPLPLNFALPKDLMLFLLPKVLVEVEVVIYLGFLAGVMRGLLKLGALDQVERLLELRGLVVEEHLGPDRRPAAPLMIRWVL
ncbi:WD repeat-containing protein 16 [Symbiodinium microadriaticum]|uniref:Cilia- and flagella-associated protein 52 n=1 Tax=Symbiodinium microadriaticum TaxID=2951 RepID=A0A1Q9CBS2_SYMMI|nr:WD repeat-containing protein 16 [Symbiodinium microadriaticum]